MKKLLILTLAALLGTPSSLRAGKDAPSCDSARPESGHPATRKPEIRQPKADGPAADIFAPEKAALEAWSAGEHVSPQTVARSGPERCFAACEIDDATFARMRGKSYTAACTIPRSELRYLKVLHYDLDGRITLGEMVCNKAIAADLLEIFRTLYEARYPIQRMVLIDEYDAVDERSMQANNSSSFVFRKIAGKTTLSKHSRGLAVDINPLYNPCVRDAGATVEPEAGRPYADRTHEFPCKIDTSDLCYREFVRHGFTWGGSWHSLKDYQHFEKDL